MPLRLRLTIWFGLLTGAVAVLVATLTYTVHARAHYDDIDQRLADVGQVYVSASEAGGAAQLGIGHPAVSVRLYDSTGNITATTDEATLAPSLQPQAVLSDPAGPAYDVIVRLLPFSPVSIAKGSGEFGIVRDGGGDRWRVYVAPLGENEGFVLTAFELARLDNSMSQFRLLVIALLVLGGVVTVGGGWGLAGLALRPVANVTSTAAAIAHERAFDRRVEVESADEIGRLAATFNEMLDNLEETYRRELRFVGDASHELRAPLTAIQADLQLLEHRPDMSAEMREQIVTSATREIRRLSQLVNDLLALARADAGLDLDLQPVELDRVLLDALNEIRSLAGEHELQVDELTPVMIDGQRDRLIQLLIILLDNAIKYTPPGGLIALSLRETPEGAELTVRDTGVGIPEQDLPHVFERLYRADPARSRDPGGTGLGLSIARWIVDQHHAQIEIESRQGQGTTVRVVFQRTGTETG
jgi:signal transduction histidine kinase